MPAEPCTICGSTEPSHAHNRGEIVPDYFTVGRGEMEISAARRWQDRATTAEAVMRQACEWIDRDGGEPMVAVADMRRHLKEVEFVCPT